MYIILKSFLETSEVLNIFYGEDINLIRNWINEYVNDDIDSLKMKPLNKDVRSIEYSIKEDQNKTQLIKREKKINRGYIYNSSERSEEIIYTITRLEYDGINVFNPTQYTLHQNEMWSDINTEINNRVLKQLDKESLYQILVRIQNAIKLKSNWNYTEYTSLVSETVKTFKKELYSSIAKRLKRFGKKQKQNQERNIAFHYQWSGVSCHLESNTFKDKLE